MSNLHNILINYQTFTYLLTRLVKAGVREPAASISVRERGDTEGGQISISPIFILAVWYLKSFPVLNNN